MPFTVIGILGILYHAGSSYFEIDPARRNVGDPRSGGGGAHAAWRSGSPAVLPDLLAG